jgi:pimeloyl-ACP methyl ester carboxylesterase
MPFAVVHGHRLAYAWYGSAANARPIVMLHEGLGSVALWREFPQRLADATCRRVLAYSRLGYGKSDPLTGPRSVDFMHLETLDTLPVLLDALGVEEPVLFGHSDGGSIALAPHVLVEPYGLASIAAARRAYLDGDLRAKLARYHDDVDSAFWGWNDIWLNPAFVAWNIEPLLPDIPCPVLAIQGIDDEYGTMEQIDRLQQGVRNLQRLELADCGHSPHRDQPDAVLSAVKSFHAHQP